MWYLMTFWACSNRLLKPREGNKVEKLINWKKQSEEKLNISVEMKSNANIVEYCWTVKDLETTVTCLNLQIVSMGATVHLTASEITSKEWNKHVSRTVVIKVNGQKEQITKTRKVRGVTGDKVCKSQENIFYTMLYLFLLRLDNKIEMHDKAIHKNIHFNAVHTLLGHSCKKSTRVIIVSQLEWNLTGKKANCIHCALGKERQSNVEELSFHFMSRKLTNIQMPLQNHDKKIGEAWSRKASLFKISNFFVSKNYLIEPTRVKIFSLTEGKNIVILQRWQVAVPRHFKYYTRVVLSQVILC